jgi:hypothetical protein
MTDPEQLRDLERELGRVVDRLTSMPLAKAASAADDCRRAGLVIVEQTRLLTDDIPADADLPELGPQGLGAMLAVLGTDYLAAARRTPDADVSAVTAALVDLRRALP